MARQQQELRGVNGLAAWAEQHRKLLVAAPVVLVLGAVGSGVAAANDHPAMPPQAAVASLPRSETARAAAVRPPEPYDASQKARQLVGALDRESTDAIINAKQILASIHTEDRCIPEVRKAVSTLITKERKVLKIDQTATKVAGEIVRKQLADKVEKSLLESSVEATVYLSGDEKTTLHIDSFICGKVFLYKNFGAEVTGSMEKIGFRRIVCETAFNSISMPLSPQEYTAPFTVDDAPRCATARASARARPAKTSGDEPYELLDDKPARQKSDDLDNQILQPNL